MSWIPCIQMRDNFFKLYIYLFIYGRIGSSLLHAGFLQLQRVGATLHCGARASHCGGFSCCGARSLGAWASVVVAHGLQQLWLVGSRAQAQQLWRTGLVAPRHVGSSRTRARTHVPCIGRQILNHCTTREVPRDNFTWSDPQFLCYSLHPNMPSGILNFFYSYIQKHFSLSFF